MGNKSKTTRAVEVETLSPVISDSYGKQIGAIKSGLRQGATNIGVTSPYCGGKSSLIATFLAKRKYSSKTISASFADLSEGKTPENSRELIEKSLVQQLLFSCEPEKLKGSRIFRAKDNYLSGFFFGLGIFLLCFCAAFAYISINIRSFALAVVELEWLHDISLLLAPIWPYIVAPLVALSVVFIFVHVKSLRVKAMDLEIEIDKDTDKAGNCKKNDSLLSKYFDELVYVFKKSKKRILVLEDLDRPEKFDKNIFVDFRQLNIALNSAKELRPSWIKCLFNRIMRDKTGEKITFIYCFDDKVFEKETVLQKFFDLVVPVVPIINSGNCMAVLSGKMSRFNDLKEYVLEDKDDTRFLPLLANYVNDMRVLISALNEYLLIYEGTINPKKDISVKKKEVKRNLLLCFYHNLYPKEYEKLFSDEGEYRQAIKIVEANKESYRKTLSNELSEMAKKRTLPKPIPLLNKYKYMINGVLNTKQNGYYLSNRRTQNIDQIESFLDKNAEIEYDNPAYGFQTRMSIKDIESVLGVDLFDEIELPLKRSAAAADDKYKELDSEINSLPTNPVEFAKRYPEQAFQKASTDDSPVTSKASFLFMRAMIVNGYFDDSLLDVLSSRTEQETKGSTSFIKRALIEKTEDISLVPVLSPFDLCDKLDTYFFDDPWIINADIIETILTQAIYLEDGTNKKLLLTKLLKKESDVVLEKAKRLIFADFQTHPKMFAELLKNKNYLVSCLDDGGEPLDKSVDLAETIERIIRLSWIDVSNQEKLPEIIKKVWTYNNLYPEDSKRLLKYAKAFEQSGIKYQDIGFAIGSPDTVRFLSESDVWELTLDNIMVLLGENLENEGYDGVLKELEKREKYEARGLNVEKLKKRLTENEVQARFLFIERKPQTDVSKMSMEKLLALLEGVEEVPINKERLKDCLMMMDGVALTPKVSAFLGFNSDSATMSKTDKGSGPSEE